MKKGPKRNMRHFGKEKHVIAQERLFLNTWKAHPALPDSGNPVQPGLWAPGKSIDAQLMMERSKDVKFDSLDLHVLLLWLNKRA